MLKKIANGCMLIIAGYLLLSMLSILISGAGIGSRLMEHDAPLKHYVTLGAMLALAITIPALVVAPVVYELFGKKPETVSEGDLQELERAIENDRWSAVRDLAERYPGVTHQQVLERLQQRAVNASAWDRAAAIDERLESVNEGTFLYVLGIDSPDPLYKIGISSDPESRRDQLETGSAYETKLLFTRGPFRFADRIESWMHQRFSDKKTKGEWFRLNEQDLHWIKTVEIKDTDQWTRSRK